MTITLPYPPSVNNLYMTIRGKRILSTQGRRFKETAGLIAKAAGMKPIAGEVRVRVDLYRPRKSGDLDNFLKATLDSVKGVAWGDDSQVVCIVARRFEDKGNPRVVLTVEEFQ